MTKTILITGGTRGIGAQLVEQYLQKNYQVIATGSNPNSVGQARKLNPQVHWLVCDLSVLSDVETLANKLEAKKLDLVIHNAGVQQPRNYVSSALYEVTEHQETMINLTSPMLLTRLLFKNVQSAQGTWVFVTSGLAIAPKQSSAVYCANKAGLRVFSKSLRAQITQNNQQVRVCEAILPMVDTDMTRGRGRGKISPEQAAREIMAGIERHEKEIRVGKTKWLMRLRRLFPNLAESVMLRA